MLSVVILGILGVWRFAHRDVEYSAPWRLQGVSQDGRTLYISYEAGGCANQDGKAGVKETEDSVTIDVKQTYALGVGCNLDLVFAALAVPLEHPIDGRSVRGGPFFNQEVPRFQMPGLVGLQLTDARRGLGGFYLGRSGRLAQSGMIVSQQPSPGTRLRRTSHIRVRTRAR